MRVAAIQFHPTTGDIVGNGDRMIAFIHRCATQRVDLVVFPEISDIGYDLPTVMRCATRLDEGVVPRIQKAAKEDSINVVAGIAEKEADGIYNATIVINRQGEIVAKQRKTHLATMEPIREHEFLRPGKALTNFTLENVPFGVLTCYEIRFPEIARTLALNGARVLLIPAAFPHVRLSHWTTLLTARAIENQVFVVAANQGSPDSPKGPLFAGTSTILDPFGIVLAVGGPAGETVTEATLDLDIIDKLRVQISVFQDRRPDLYKM